MSKVDVNALTERATSLFIEGFNCAQASYKAVCESYGIDGDARVAACFGGGMGRTGGACGILTGTLMGLGMMLGSNDPKDASAKDRSTRLAREFMAQFKQIQQHIDCRGLTGIEDIATDQGQELFKSRGVRQSVCLPLMRDTMALVSEFIEKEGIVKA